MNTLLSLLALDAIACRAGCGLKPELRRAIEAQTRFPSVAAGPTLSAELSDDALPESVTRLRPITTRCNRKTA
ncbi:MAG: hypothetical protein AAF999_07950 [Pseudomonadota bacterium]